MRDVWVGDLIQDLTGGVCGKWHHVALSVSEFCPSSDTSWYLTWVRMLPNMLVTTLGHLFPRAYSLCMFVFSGKPVLCPWRAPVQSSCPRRNLALSFHIARPFSSQAAEDQKEEPPHSIISSTETVQGTAFSCVGVWVGLAPGGLVRAGLWGGSNDWWNHPLASDTGRSWLEGAFLKTMNVSSELPTFILVYCPL